MKYRLIIYFTDGEEEDAGVFDTREEAEDEYQVWLENFRAGEEILYLANDDDYTDADIEDYEIEEVDDNEA